MNGQTRAGAQGWHDDEVVLAGLPDKRLARRFGRLLDQLSAAPGQPVPAACGDWAATKAAYRFFDKARKMGRKRALNSVELSLSSGSASTWRNSAPTMSALVGFLLIDPHTGFMV